MFSSLIISYNLFNLYFLVKYKLKNDEIEIPATIPKFIKNKLVDLYNISKFKNYDMFLDLYLKNLIYTFSLFVLILIITHILQ